MFEFHCVLSYNTQLQDKVLTWLQFPLTGFKEKDQEILSMSFEVYLMFQDMAKVAKKIDLRCVWCVVCVCVWWCVCITMYMYARGKAEVKEVGGRQRLRR